MDEKDLHQKRVEIANYVSSMVEGTARSENFPTVVEAALTKGILDHSVTIPDELIEEWYATIFLTQSE